MSVGTKNQEFIYDPFAPEIFEDPYPEVQGPARRAPPLLQRRARLLDALALRRLPGGRPATGRASPAAAGSSSTRPRPSTPKPSAPGNIVITDPPDHRRIRRAVQQHFTPQAVQALEPMIRTIVNRLLDRLEEGAEADLAGDFAWRIPVATVSQMLGFPEEEQDPLADLLFDFETREPDEDDRATTSRSRPRRGKRGRGWPASSTSEIAARRAAPGDDLLTVLVQAEEEGALAPEEARGMTFILVMAGVDTTACLVSNGLHRLCDRPEDRRRIAEDPEFATRRDRGAGALGGAGPGRGPDRPRGRRHRRRDDSHRLPGLALLRRRQPRRAPLRGPRAARLRAAAEAPPRLRRGDPPLHRRAPRPPRGPDRVGRAVPPLRLLRDRRGAKRHHQHTTRGWTRLPAELEKG